MRSLLQHTKMRFSALLIFQVTDITSLNQKEYYRNLLEMDAKAADFAKATGSKVMKAKAGMNIIANCSAGYQTVFHITHLKISQQTPWIDSDVTNST